MHASLKEGHTFGWASDVSEKGFSFRNGVAIVPETELEEMSDSERSKWANMDEKERSKETKGGGLALILRKMKNLKGSSAMSEDVLAVKVECMWGGEEKGVLQE